MTSTEPSDRVVSRAAPLIPDVGVIALVPDRWGRQWQLRHQVLSRLARYYRVAWVNPAPEWRDVLAEPARWRVEDADPVPGLHVHSPDRMWPRFHRPVWFANAVSRARLGGARRHLLAQGCKRVVLYVWRPEFADALDEVAHDASAYHIDDEYSFSTTDAPIPPTELGLMKRADQVFIHSPALFEKKGHVNPATTVIPNGVDYRAHADPVPEPDDLAAIPGPRIGYTGWLKAQLDWGLVEGLAKAHPEWSFVFVGAIQRDLVGETVDALGELSNVHILGARTSAELARYPQHFDVCVMPYNDDDYTRYIYPLKLHEYLASGTPTVGTPIRSLQAFAEVIGLPRSQAEWSEAITKAIADTSPETRTQRQLVARDYDYDILVGRIAEQLAESLGNDVADRLRGLA